MFIGCLAYFLKNISFFYEINPIFYIYVKNKATGLLSVALQFMNISTA